MSPEYKTLISREQISQKLQEMGQRISHDYDGQPLVVISVLKGAFIFTADLIRHINLPVSVEFIGVASYQGTRSTGHVRITNDLTCDVKGKHILLVEDIIDTGKTIDYLMDMLEVREPASLKICSFLSRPECHVMKRKINYTGFEIGNEFVIGYGLDLDGRYRELPYVAQVTSLPEDQD